MYFFYKICSTFLMFALESVSGGVRVSACIQILHSKIKLKGMFKFCFCIEFSVFLYHMNNNFYQRSANVQWRKKYGISCCLINKLS